MKKVIIQIGSTKREANANEYPMRYEPKSDAVKGQANGKETRIRFTSGKGKSAINNHYIYFVEGEILFFTRSDAGEVERAKKEPVVIIDAVETQAALPPTEPAKDTTPAPETPKEAPKGRRQRAKA
jgi:hypothetical protein